tara:strand:- start:201 stop:398 length:198 start_codon:yes stop_codon:yes gene_type:complete
MEICKDTNNDKAVIDMFWNTNAYTTAKLTVEPKIKKLLKDFQVDTDSLEGYVNDVVLPKVKIKEE